MTGAGRRGGSRVVRNGLQRYREAHDGDSPAQLVLHPEHRKALMAELPGGVECDVCMINDVLLIDALTCRFPYFVSADNRRWEL